MKIYDLVIIGSGPAGMSAAIYAQRAMLDFIVIEKEYMPGGQVVQTYEVDNYPGIPKTNGMDLGMKFSEHAKELGVESITAEVKEINADNEIKEIILKNGDILKNKDDHPCNRSSPSDVRSRRRRKTKRNGSILLCNM